MCERWFARAGLLFQGENTLSGKVGDYSPIIDRKVFSSIKGTPSF